MSDLYTLPDGWEWKKLDDITELITKGTTPTTNGYKFQSSGINFLKIENIVNGEIDLSTIEMFISEEAHQSQKRSQLQENDVLFSIAGTIGDTAIVKKEHLPMNTNQAIALIRPKNILNTFFLKYSLLSIISQNTKDKQRGGAIKNISLGDIKDLNYPLPLLEEQKRIVAKLDILFAKIDCAIALHQKNIDEVNVFMASVLNDIFVELEEKYKKLNINNIATIKGGKRVPKGYTLLEEITPYPYLRVTDFKDYGTICTKKMLYLTKEVYEQIKRYTITDEDLYITNVGNTIGKSGIIPSELNGANLTENAVKLVYKDKKNTSNKFMYYFTKTSIFLIQLESATMQMAVPKLAIMRLGEIELPFPPIEVQQKVVSYLDEISQKMEKIKQIQKEKMQSLKELKASILDQAFKGEL